MGAGGSKGSVFYLNPQRGHAIVGFNRWMHSAHVDEIEFLIWGKENYGMEAKYSGSKHCYQYSSVRTSPVSCDIFADSLPVIDISI